MSKIEATVVADSINLQNDRLTSVLVTMPRIILSEVNTHRMLSKNTSSSRAIPFNKMVEAVQNNPFIPVAWQNHHSGMQGSEYLDETLEYDLVSFMTILNDTLSNSQDDKERAKLRKRIEEKTRIIQEILSSYTHLRKTLPEWWLFARDKAIEAASILYVFDVTKQLCNRLLEPFMWTTMLITGSREGWSNFFELRCPSYKFESDEGFKSWKEVVKKYPQFGLQDESLLYRLQHNKGQAEIHIMDLAEKIYDAMKESTPKQLEAGEWHIPFRDKLYLTTLREQIDTSKVYKEGIKVPAYVKISTAMAARTSYTVVGDEKEIDYEKMIELHDRLLSQNPPHSSPLEHCARAMSDDEYYGFQRGRLYDDNDTGLLMVTDNSSSGWCNNIKGFIQYRYLVDNGQSL